MNGRAGFTLLELIVALVLAGVVALLVYGASAAAFDTQDRLEERRLALRSVQAWRATLEDALRNARPAPTYQDTAFWLDDRTDIGGRPRDRISFLTAGGLPPLTADSDWRVTVTATEQGLTLLAQPVGALVPARRIVGVPGITGLQVRVREFTPELAWSDTWRFPRLVPRAIELTYWSDAGPVGPPVRLALPLGGVQ